MKSVSPVCFCDVLSYDVKSFKWQRFALLTMKNEGDFRVIKLEGKEAVTE